MVNNQIRAWQVRVVDENGKQLGVFPLEKALQMARERNLDLIQVTEKLETPVCKIMDFGKYQYLIHKKEKETKIKKGGEMKTIRFGYNISLHDIETRVHQAEKFLKKGDIVRIEMVLRGREKGFGELAKIKINQFLEILEKLIPIKVERELKKEFKGFTMIIIKQ